MAVDTTHAQHSRALSRWTYTRDACDAEEVKRKREAYLPLLSDHKSDPGRYDAYHERAYYVNVTGRTRDGLVGAVFRRDPTWQLPPEIEYLAEDSDGSGVSLIQLSKDVLSEVLQTGRHGLLVDYPTIEVDNPSAEQTSRLQARIVRYRAESILNWRFTTESGRLRLLLVVLSESDEDEIDEFEYREVNRYRVLRLRQGVYTQQIYDKGGQPLTDEFFPRRFDGSFWDRIPFHFVGSESNRPEVGPTPLYDLAQVNVAQYRNIADREETLHIAGQPTLFISSDLDPHVFKEANPDGIRVGVRKGHFIGANGKAEMLQAKAVDAHDHAIDQKAEQMVSIGARLILKQGQNQTAEAARIAASGEHSVLSTITGNVSEAIEGAIEDCGQFMGSDPELVQFQLSQQFWEEGADPQMIMAMIQLEDRGTIGQNDTRDYLRRTRAINPTRTNDDIDEEATGAGPRL